MTTHLARDLQDPQFLREYVAESVRIATIDRMVNELDAARQAARDRAPALLIRPRQPDSRHAG